MDPVNAWLRMAEENLRVAVALETEGRLRPAANRAYYACYHAGHALLLAHGHRPPARRNWAHDTLIDAVFAVLRRAGFSVAAANHVRLNYQAALDGRIIADYGPLGEVEPESVSAGRAAAHGLMSFARRKMGNA